MAKSNRNAVTRQVEQIIRRLGSLSTLPEVAAGFLPHLTNGRINTPALSEIIESDPALTAKILSLAQSRGVKFTDGRPSVAEAVATLPPAVVRDAVLSVKVFQVFDVDYDPDRERPLARKQMALHALAVACAARSIAELVLPEQDRQLAFSAGLLHDIGKLAIDEVMPKSFAKIVSEAKDRGVSLSTVTQEHLGIDHTIVGKRLAEKWALPEEVIFAIWLQNNDPNVLVEDLPRAKMALIVQLAFILARQCGIGQSGDFDAVPSCEETIRALGLNAEQIETIRNDLLTQVAAKRDLLGLDIPGGLNVYCDRIGQTAAQLSQDHSQLAQKSQIFAADASQMSFVHDFLLSITPQMSAIEVAVNFVTGFQKHYQTGNVCMYMQISPEDLFLDLISINDSGRITTSLISLPVGTPAVPKTIQDKFGIVEVVEVAPWLLEQVDLDVAEAKMVPLLTNGRSIGALLFKQRIPVDFEQLVPLLSVSTSIVANVIGMKFTTQKQASLAERFAELLGRLRDTRGELAEVKALAGIAEMAAGAAHELNNPLAVISGRAQLMLDIEPDENKKQMLIQIQQRTDEISEIITDLMTFARPGTPTRVILSLRELIDEAIKRTAEKHGLTQVEASVEGIETLGDVYVDREQIRTALGHIVSNALQAYKGDGGPVTICPVAQQPDEAVTFTIIDQGCGMTSETLAKAFDPFFSDRPAGRKRGMGLSHARRLILLNNGSISLASQPQKGTTVMITLPRM
ncbi:MAG: HDOD domain-containing protein [Sedimentisphaerales bacterium]|nr:HDOD domain-containing protein [Sedimentisphaerales bacterium]